MSLQVIGAGFGRTGTLSLKVALETLGFAPCHHMATVFTQPGRLAAWEDVLRRSRRGDPIDWSALMAGFRATVDWPSTAYWRELAAAFPEAKVLLSVRDPERWYDSARDTIYRLAGPDADPELAAALPPEIAARAGAARGYIGELLWDDTFGGRFLDREHAIRVFTDHTEAVQAAIPPGRLLVYEVKEGWEPLCRFLGVPAPVDTPFPHLNDSLTMLDRFRDPDAVLRQIMAAG